MKVKLLFYILFVFLVAKLEIFSQTTDLTDTSTTLTDTTIDTDGDGIADVYDSDANGDGVTDWIANSGLTDANNNGTPDEWEKDTHHALVRSVPKSLDPQAVSFLQLISKSLKRLDQTHF